jgi:hypothetical protein
MRVALLVLSCSVGLVAASARADDPWKAPLDAAPTVLREPVAVDLLPEIRRAGQTLDAIGRAASEHAADPRVRRLGDRMARDLDALEGRAAAYARRHGIDVPAPAASPSDAVAFVALGGGLLEGPSYDRVFLAVARNRSEALAARMRQLEPTVRDRDFARLLRTYAPILEQHAEIARVLSAEKP